MLCHAFPYTVQQWQYAARRQQARRASQDVRDDSDEDLLVYVGWKAEHPELASAACDEFYRRHLKYVYAVIDRAYGSELGKEGVMDMVTDTFLRVYERAHTYQPCGEKDQGRQRRNALAWVSTIAVNSAGTIANRMRGFFGGRVE